MGIFFQTKWILLEFKRFFWMGIYTQFGHKGMSTNGGTLKSMVELAVSPLKL